MTDDRTVDKAVWSRFPGKQWCLKCLVGERFYEIVETEFGQNFKSMPRMYPGSDLHQQSEGLYFALDFHRDLSTRFKTMTIELRVTVWSKLMFRPTKP